MATFITKTQLKAELRKPSAAPALCPQLLESASSPTAHPTATAPVRWLLAAPATSLWAAAGKHQPEQREHLGCSQEQLPVLLVLII